MTKLRLWELTQFDQVVYIDADCMVLDCLDELFERCADLDFAAAPDVFPPDRFNAGVLYLRPSKETFLQLCAQLPVLVSYDGGDTGFLNAFFPHWYSGPAASRLPFGYNMQRTLYWFTYEKRPGYWDSVQPKKIVHFSSSPKPWETSMSSASSRGDLEFLWWQTLMGM
jgi:glycogenin glucosyltransferase